MKRADVYELRMPTGKGHEQRDKRFGVVVQTDAWLPSSVVLVAPTSTSARASTLRPELVIKGARTRVLVEQLSAVDATRLGKRVATVDPSEMWAIDDALRTVLAL